MAYLDKFLKEYEDERKSDQDIVDLNKDTIKAFRKGPENAFFTSRYIKRFEKMFEEKDKQQFLIKTLDCSSTLRMELRARLFDIILDVNLKNDTDYLVEEFIREINEREKAVEEMMVGCNEIFDQVPPLDKNMTFTMRFIHHPLKNRMKKGDMVTFDQPFNCEMFFGQYFKSPLIVFHLKKGDKVIPLFLLDYLFIEVILPPGQYELTRISSALDNIIKVYHFDLLS
jgi:hypothetical protein